VGSRHTRKNSFREAPAHSYVDLAPDKRHTGGGYKNATDARDLDVSRDWAIACDAQQRFMQRLDHIAHSLDYSARWRQMLELGGDCYDFTSLTDERLAITIGDASGEGLAATLMIATVQSSLRTAPFSSGSDSATAREVVSRQVYASSLAGRSATLFYGAVDGATRTLTYVNAGHNPPAIARRNGSTPWLEAGGAPVGMFQDSSYQRLPSTSIPATSLLLTPMKSRKQSVRLGENGELRAY